ncbi:putative uncharacterized protein DDB_G0271606 [Drosophila nasuta]|uniref:putative uncharacterized protein DDB_G0271606 n=1 Tax=Drosophila nasuta TaxID=42062 RepID=UPI00295F4E4B|nr:putative uncharacterized protein DDB_G0271606 [Drosophila nasuta]
MHCLILYLTTAAALLTVTSGAGIRPLLSISRADNLRDLPRITITQAEPLRRGYQEQDTARAFYSYGYSDENAARAEYTTQDGSSRGFYSYVDANGKLQTVKYEAGGRQGFKAEGSNLPQAPVDDKKPPLPVTDTLEVQQARQAHLDAVREAEEEARREEVQQLTEQQQQQQSAVSERTLSDEDADILERVRAELTSMLADRQRDESRLDEQQTRKQDSATSNAAAQNEANEEERDADAREEQREEQPRQQQLPPRDQRLQDGNDGNDLRLRTVYTLADISSSSYLKLSDLEDRLDRNSQELRVPIGAYYSYSSPNAKYSVTTPTEVRTLRPIALSRSLLLSKQNQNQN